MDQKTYYRKVRDLGGIFSAAFTYSKQNFKSFYGSLLFFAGPFLLVGSVTSSYMMHSVFGLSAAMGRGLPQFFQNFIGAYIIAIIVFFIGGSVYNVTLNKHIIDNEKLPAGETLSVRQVAENFFGSYWRVMGNMLLLMITVGVAVGLIVLVFIGIASLFSGIDTGGAILLGILLVLLVLAFFIILMPIVCFVPLAALFVCQRDDIGIFEALGKVLFYMKKNFWSTWVVSMIALLCYSVMAGIAQIPVMIVTFITAFSRVQSTVGYGVGEDSTPVLLTVVTAICSLLSYLVGSIYYLMCIYQYTNLEEKKEGSFIMQKINEI